MGRVEEKEESILTFWHSRKKQSQCGNNIEFKYSFESADEIKTWRKKVMKVRGLTKSNSRNIV